MSHSIELGFGRTAAPPPWPAVNPYCPMAALFKLKAALFFAFSSPKWPIWRSLV
jgi:hypothetical protein